MQCGTYIMPRLDTEPVTMPEMKVEDYVEVDDTDADDTEPERIMLPLRAGALTPNPERFPLRHDTWGEITRDTITDALEFTPTDTWLDD